MVIIMVIIMDSIMDNLNPCVIPISICTWGFLHPSVKPDALTLCTKPLFRWVLAAPVYAVRT